MPKEQETAAALPLPPAQRQQDYSSQRVKDINEGQAFKELGAYLRLEKRLDTQLLADAPLPETDTRSWVAWYYNTLSRYISPGMDDKSYRAQRVRGINEGQAFKELGEWFRLEQELGRALLANTPRVQLWRSWYYRKLSEYSGCPVAPLK